MKLISYRTLDMKSKCNYWGNPLLRVLLSVNDGMLYLTDAIKLYYLVGARCSGE